MATWDATRGRARVEVIISDEALFGHAEARARRLGLSLPAYLQQLARAVMLLEGGDSSLMSLLGLSGAAQVPAPAAPSAPPAAPAGDNRLLDSALDQLGL